MKLIKIKIKRSFQNEGICLKNLEILLSGSGFMFCFSCMFVIIFIIWIIFGHSFHQYLANFRLFLSCLEIKLYMKGNGVYF